VPEERNEGEPRNNLRVYTSARPLKHAPPVRLTLLSAPQRKPTWRPARDPMSAAAEEIIAAYAHPDLTGSSRELLRAIAKLIPEGATMTSAITDRDLAALIGCQRRTIRTVRPRLRAAGLIRVVGGGKGRPGASYELLLLPGSGAPPQLPLRADLREVRRSRRAVPQTGTLFDDDRPREVSAAANVGSPILRATPHVGSYVGNLILRWCRIVTNLGSLVSYVGSTILRWPEKMTNLGSYVGNLILRSRQVLDVDDARARDVRTHLQEVHTHAPPRGPTCCRAHIWCSADGRVHVPVKLHGECRAKLRLTDDELFAVYAAEVATLAPDAVIPPNDFTFWRPRLAARFGAVSAPPPSPGAVTPRRSAAAPARPWTCVHNPPTCIDRDACIDRQTAEFRERERRKSG
jgi:hypothetical protein